MDEQIRNKKEKNRLKVKAWRNQLKTENKEKYENLKKSDRERKKEERIKAKKIEDSNPELRALHKKKEAERVRHYRQKKKRKN